MTVLDTTDRELLAKARAADLAGATDRALTLYLGVLAAAGSSASPECSDVLRWVGNISLRRGAYDDALAHYARSYDVATSCGYRAGVAHAINCEAVARQHQGNVERALELYRAAAADAAAVEDHRLVGMIEQNTAVVMSVRGEWDAAVLRYRMSLRAFEAAADDQAASWVLNNMGTLYRERRQLSDAEQAITRARALADRCGDTWTLFVIELNYADVLLDLGHVARAEALCERAIAVASDRGDHVHQAKALRCRARVFSGRRAWTEAAHDLERALGLARACGDASLVAEILMDLGGVRRHAGHPQALVRRTWDEALELFTLAGARHHASTITAQLSTL